MSYSENYALAMKRIKELELKLEQRTDPLAHSMVEFLVHKDMMLEWANFYIEKGKP